MLKYKLNIIKKSLTQNKVRLIIIIFGYILSSAFIVFFSDLSNSMGKESLNLIGNHEDDMLLITQRMYYYDLQKLNSNPEVKKITNITYSYQSVKDEYYNFIYTDNNAFELGIPIGESKLFISKINFISGNFWNENNVDEELIDIIIDTTAKKKLISNGYEINEVMNINDQMFNVIGIFEYDNLFKNNFLVYDTEFKNDQNMGTILLNNKLLSVYEDPHIVDKAIIEFNTPYISETILEQIKTLGETEELNNKNVEKVAYKREDVKNLITTGSKIFTMFLNIVLLLSLIITSLCMIGYASFIVMEKYSEIAIQKICGATKKDLLSRYVLECLIYIIIGVTVGMIIGKLLFIIVSITTGLSPVLNVLPILLIYSISILFGVLTGIIVGLKAIKVNFVKAITEYK